MRGGRSDWWGWLRDLVAVGAGIWLAYRDHREAAEDVTATAATATTVRAQMPVSSVGAVATWPEPAREVAPWEREPSTIEWYCVTCYADVRRRFPNLEPAEGALPMLCYWHSRPEVLTLGGKRLLLLDGRRYLDLQADTITN